MYILGINAYHGDASAAIIKDGKLLAAVEEERFNRFKHCAGFPAESIRYCMKVAGVTIEDVEHIGISRDPSAHLHKKILFAAGRAAKQVAGGKKAGGRRQEAGGELGIDVLASGEVGQTPAVAANGERNGEDHAKGNGSGIFQQVRD